MMYRRGTAPFGHKGSSGSGRPLVFSPQPVSGIVPFLPTGRWRTGRPYPQQPASYPSRVIGFTSHLRFPFSHPSGRTIQELTQSRPWLIRRRSGRTTDPERTPNESIRHNPGKKTEFEAAFG